MQPTMIMLIGEKTAIGRKMLHIVPGLFILPHPPNLCSGVIKKFLFECYLVFFWSNMCGLALALRDWGKFISTKVGESNSRTFPIFPLSSSTPCFFLFVKFFALLSTFHLPNSILYTFPPSPT